ncbi:MAG: formylglycine-generating enzyme family protein [Acidobacteria bacterium]|nr:formylglycine-generating enzyme family protein [Acidobacteriota bacterium]
MTPDEVSKWWELLANRVGEKDANAFGLHDTLGNAWEWCSDGGSAWPEVRRVPCRARPGLSELVSYGFRCVRE